ncbi:MAG: YeeE/YedE family protein [Rhizobiales bacterium]|nr:YeeE/YedE family protein [Hyphomicrobiales bacterium]NRB14689.1 YeeE/YedE family protein [Hyphomicrobiales bacterium]
MKFISAFITGIIFGIGILMSGMANPAKVINFFDVAGTWDPSLGFVMGGGLVVAFIGYRYILKLPNPLFNLKFQLPTKKSLDINLIGGSALFGIGWGISGFCPGGALPAVGTLNADVLTFCAALVVGIYATKITQNMLRKKTNLN